MIPALTVIKALSATVKVFDAGIVNVPRVKVSALLIERLSGRAIVLPPAAPFIIRVVTPKVVGVVGQISAGNVAPVAKPLPTKVIVPA